MKKFLEYLSVGIALLAGIWVCFLLFVVVTHRGELLALAPRFTWELALAIPLWGCIIGFGLKALSERIR